MARKKKERLTLRISETLDDFIERRRKEMSEQLGEHVDKSEVGRRMLNVFLYLDMSPEADLGKIVNHAAKFEEFLKEEYGTDEEGNIDADLSKTEVATEE